MKRLALSLKQPWAALLVAGRKSIEVRRWPTRYRGELLIHAARVDDKRRKGWELVDDEVRPLAELRGGVIGMGVLTEVREYRKADVFNQDAELHLNNPDWFEPGGLYGFCFDLVRAVEYVRVSGNVRLFEVDVEVTECGPVSAQPTSQPQAISPPIVEPPGGPLTAILSRFHRLLRSLSQQKKGD